MAQRTFEVVVSTLDKASGPFRRIAEQMRPLTALTQSVNRSGTVGATVHGQMSRAMAAHAEGLRGHFQRASAAFDGLRNSALAFAPALGAISAGGAIAGLAALTKRMSEAALAGNAMHTQIGISEAQFQTYQLAARMVGVQADGLGVSLTKLQKAMSEAAGGQREPLAALFQHLKIPLKDSKGAVIDVAAALPRLMDAFQKTADAGLRTRMAAALFEEEGLALIPMLAQGSAALKAYADMNARLNFAPPPAANEALKQYAQGWVQLETAGGGFMKDVASRLAPILLPLVKLATDWVVASRDWLPALIAQRMEGLATAIGSINFTQLATTMGQWGETMSAIIEPIGGMNLAIGAIALTLGAPLLSAIGSTIGIMGALGKAMMAVSALAWANPIVLGVAAVAAVGVLLYRNWETVQRVFDGVWKWFSRPPDWVRNLVDAINPFVRVPEFMNAAWEMGKRGLERVWTWFKSSMAWVWPLVNKLRPLVNAAAQVMEIWKPVERFFEDLWKGVVSWFVWAWEKMKPIVDRIMEAARALELPGNAPPSPFQNPATPPMTPLLPDGRRRPSSFPMLYDSPPVGTRAAAEGSGHVDVTVTLANAPPGTRVTTKTGGSTLGAVRTNVGYSYPFGDSLA